MSDRPRTWTLVGTGPSELPVVEAGMVLVDEEVRVIELEPILDLLERLQDRDVLTVTLTGVALRADVADLLREHGRLEET